MQRISQHISYKEATFSQTATRKDIDNTPSEEILERMRIVAENIFEPLRAHVGGPIKINSFYRSIMLNTAIGGSKSSQHTRGEAIDLDDTLGCMSNKDMFTLVTIDVSSLIYYLKIDFYNFRLFICFHFFKKHQKDAKSAQIT